MAIPTKIKQLAHDVRNKIYGEDVRESIAKGMEESGNIADESNERSKNTSNRQNILETRYDVQVGAMTEDTEIIDARVGSDGVSVYENIKKRLDNEYNNLDTEITDVGEGALVKSVNALVLGAIGDGVSDDTRFIQETFNKANKYRKSSNEIGGTNYYTSNGKVKIPPGFYGISSTIIVPKGIDIDMEGAVFIGLNQDGRILCFDITSNAFRNNYYGGTFVGFDKAVKLSTDNNNTAKITFDGIVTHNCNEGIDTVSIGDSRSTVLTIKNFESIKTDKFLTTHTDMTSLSDGWIDHTGYDGPVIENHSLLKMENIICVPHPTQTGARPRWIDNYGNRERADLITPGGRGLNIEHCRFGGEEGSCPIVFNYAPYDGTYTGGYSASRIVIDDSTMFSSSATYGDSAAIVLFALPNRISITNSSGISNLINGLITCDDSFDSSTISTQKNISIFIDSSMKGADHFPLMDKDLQRFLITDDNPYNAFRKTFKGGELFKRFMVEQIDSASSKVSLNVETLKSADNSSDQRGFGFSFLLTLSSASAGRFVFKSHSTYVVSLSGGTIDGVNHKKLEYTEISSHAGGSNFGTKALIKSLHWGKGDTGPAVVPVNYVNDDITVVFTGTNNSSITVLPLWGIDNHTSV